LIRFRIWVALDLCAAALIGVHMVALGLGVQFALIDAELWNSPPDRAVAAGIASASELIAKRSASPLLRRSIGRVGSHANSSASILAPRRAPDRSLSRLLERSDRTSRLRRSRVVANLQWETIREAKAKDKRERTFALDSLVSREATPERSGTATASQRPPRRLLAAVGGGGNARLRSNFGTDRLNMSYSKGDA
jgi:hypothetical protein